MTTEISYQAISEAVRYLADLNIFWKEAGEIVGDTNTVSL